MTLTLYPSSLAPGSRSRAQRLLDIYGAILTDHQREACRLHLDEDWSFTEIAGHFGCTRSGAHDLVRRGLAQLEHYESRLGLALELAQRDAREAALRSRMQRIVRTNAGPPRNSVAVARRV